MASNENARSRKSGGTVSAIRKTAHGLGGAVSSDTVIDLIQRLVKQPMLVAGLPGLRQLQLVEDAKSHVTSLVQDLIESERSSSYREATIRGMNPDCRKETVMHDHKVVSREQWLAARRELLAEEKKLTRARDELSHRRRELPWVKVDKPYVFEAPEGKQTLFDLFAGRSQLLVYHFMFGPEWPEGCPSCSFWADNYDGTIVHLNHRDVTFVVVSRAPLDRLEAYRARMGWRFKWVSSLGSDFNHDYHVSFTPQEMQSEVEYNYGRTKFPSEEAPGLSVFFRDPDNVGVELNFAPSA